MSKLVYRNLALYFRDKVAVFFSLVGAMILIGVYILFLSENLNSSVISVVGDSLNKKDLAYLTNSFILAGMLSITTVTSSLGALGFLVNDKENKVIKDFKSSPLSFWTYPNAAVISGVVVGFIMSVVSFSVYSLFIYFNTGYFYSLLTIIKTIGLILISSTMSASLMGLIVSLLKTNSAFSSVSLLTGTLLGFVNGLYIPIGQMSNFMQSILKLLPFSHIATMFRRLLMEQAIIVNFEGALASDLLNFKEILGVTLFFNNAPIASTLSLAFITLITTVSLVLFFISFRRKSESI